MNIQLERFAYTPFGTFGRFKYGDFACYSLEDPWNFNRVGVSSIPVDNYMLAATRYNKGGYDTYEVLDVPGRTQIKIHKGNTHEDIEGCIILGRALGYIEGNWAVISSGSAFEGFIEECDDKGDPDMIEITNYEGGILD